MAFYALNTMGAPQNPVRVVVIVIICGVGDPLPGGASSPADRFTVGYSALAVATAPTFAVDGIGGNGFCGGVTPLIALIALCAYGFALICAWGYALVVLRHK